MRDPVLGTGRAEKNLTGPQASQNIYVVRQPHLGTPHPHPGAAPGAVRAQVRPCPAQRERLPEDEACAESGGSWEKDSLRRERPDHSEVRNSVASTRNPRTRDYWSLNCAAGHGTSEAANVSKGRQKTPLSLKGTQALSRGPGPGRGPAGGPAADGREAAGRTEAANRPAWQRSRPKGRAAERGWRGVVGVQRRR